MNHHELLSFLLVLPVALCAGFFGALFGLGGGIILIPGLTILLHYDFKFAVAASAISVVATSSAAASAYVAERFANVRLGMLLEMATTAGAFLGALIVDRINSQALYFIFSVVLLYAGYVMMKGRAPVSDGVPTNVAAGLDGSYVDPSTQVTVDYQVTNVPAGMFGSSFAGILSGLLGIGGGIIKVPVMNRIMRVPLKAAIATSNFTIGVTATTAAVIYWTLGLVKPEVAAPSAIGVLVGARIGTRVAGRVHSKWLRIGFAIFTVIVAIEMILKGLVGAGVHLPAMLRMVAGMEAH